MLHARPRPAESLKREPGVLRSSLARGREVRITIIGLMGSSYPFVSVSGIAQKRLGRPCVAGIGAGWEPGGRLSWS